MVELDHVKSQLKEVVKTFTEPDVFVRFGIRAPRGVLLTVVRVPARPHWPGSWLANARQIFLQNLPVRFFPSGFLRANRMSTIYFPALANSPRACCSLTR